MVRREAKTTVQQLLDFSQKSDRKLRLTLVTKNAQLDRPIVTKDLNRPGMNLFGFYEHFAFDRLQIFGKGESAYVQKLDNEGNLDSLSHFFTYLIPGIVFAYGFTPPQRFVEMADQNGIPILTTSLESPALIESLENYFGRALAPRIVMHGVMMEVYGMGILIEGEAAMGKSECALELIERGHRFVADDVVDIRIIDGKVLTATSSHVIAHHMEIRGIGIINIAHLFGIGAILSEKNIDLVVHIEQYNKETKYDRLGLEMEYTSILGMNVPILKIPIHPGSNMPILVETAAMNHRLKLVGYNPAREFNKKLTSMIEQGVDIY